MVQIFFGLDIFGSGYFLGLGVSLKQFDGQVPAPVDPLGGSPGPVKKKANSTGVSPDKDDDSPTLEQIDLVGEMIENLSF